ncbi:hypothetical protein HDU80_005200 [Chytriomyces hyalinus]|nr:hypothetical protein HDU80_005200 [Chytriomyces hyalinus]
MSRVRVVIPRPPNLFAEWIPEFALTHSTRLSLPDSWHMRANQVWLLPILAMFVHCLVQRRWLSSQWKESRRAERVLVGVEDPQLLAKKADDPPAASGNKEGNTRWAPSWTMWLFWLMLATHTLYYIVEIDSTQMLRENKGMAYHHFASYVVFFGYAKNANDICVVTLLPLVIHCLYWSFFGTTTVETHSALTMSILALYNVALLFCGSVCFVMFFALENAYSRGRVPITVRRQDGATLKAIMTHPTDLLMPLTCVAIGAVNYSIYCTLHSGSVCGAANVFDADLGTNHRVWSCILYVIWVSLSSLVGVVLGRSQWFRRLLKGDPRQLEGFTETRYQVVEGGAYQGGGRLSPIGAVLSFLGFGGIKVQTTQHMPQGILKGVFFSAGFLINAWILVSIFIHRTRLAYQGLSTLLASISWLLGICALWCLGIVITIFLNWLSRSRWDSRKPSMAIFINISLVVLLSLNVNLAMDRYHAIGGLNATKKWRSKMMLFAFMATFVLASTALLVMSPSLDGMTPDDIGVFRLWLMCLIVFYTTTSMATIVYYVATYRHIKSMLQQLIHSGSANPTLAELAFPEEEEEEEEDQDGFYAKSRIQPPEPSLQNSLPKPKTSAEFASITIENAHKAVRESEEAVNRHKAEKQRASATEYAVLVNCVIMSTGIVVLYLPFVVELIFLEHAPELANSVWVQVGSVLAGMDTIWTPVLVLHSWPQIRKACIPRWSSK